MKRKISEIWRIEKKKQYLYFENFKKKREKKVKMKQKKKNFREQRKKEKSVAIVCCQGL